MLLDGGVKRDHGVPTAILSPGQTHIANDTDEASTGDHSFVAVLPNLVELLKKLIIIFDVTELPIRISILFEGPIGWRSEHQVNAFGA